jgi:VIT1/CCC1 family predicted Fe2+/Mn2+ transporter
MRDLTRFAFGATAAIMTSMALIVGLGSANSSKMGIVGGLLIIAIADNLSDTLGIHIYEECAVRESTAVRISVSNYFTRLVIACSFVALVLVLPSGPARWASIAWGGLLLSVLTYLIAKSRSVKPIPEVATHLLVAVAVIVLSHVIGSLIERFV